MANYLIKTSLILLLALLLGHRSESVQSQRCPVLHLLNVRPIYHDSSDGATPVWDRGLDVSPAGHLAIEQINNCSNILQGYELRLIDVDSEACGVNVISRGITNLFRELVSSSHCIVGVVGLYCTVVTNVISPIISHPNIGGYVQIAASISTLHRTTPETEANLFYMAGLSSVFNQATLALMRALRWCRISIIHHTADSFFDSIANDFVQRIDSLGDMKLVTRIPTADSELHNVRFKEVFDMIIAHEARISYWSVTSTESAYLLCEAYDRGFYWPDHIYILREPMLDNILEVQTTCTKEELMIALERAFLLEYRLFANDNTTLESGLSYSEYWQMYNEKLQDFASTKNINLSGTTFANPLYDQVWAFALAINNLIELHNGQFEKQTVGQANNISELLRSELKQLSFQGASRSGRIQFNGNQAISPYISIFQIQNGIQELIGIYDPSAENVTNLSATVSSDVPYDTFSTEYNLLPVWLGVCIILVQVALLSLISMNLVLILVWRKDGEIKAISPILSTLMMVGCYLLCLRPIILVVYRMFKFSESNAEPLCILEHCMWIGFELIFATLFFKILRIYYIFRESQMTMMSNYWIDRYLFIYVIIVCLGKAILLILWYSIGHYRPNVVRVYIKTPEAHYEETLHCTSNNVTVWTTVTLLYSGVLLLMSMILAIMSRHNRSIYKDTKKVNLFIFLVVLGLAITVALWMVYHHEGKEMEANTVEWLAHFSVPMLCQVCLFVPKTLPLVLKKISFQIKQQV